MWQYLLKLLGYYYLVNKNTGEVHDLKNNKPRCGIDKMSSKNKKFLSTSEYTELMANGKFNNKTVNGCRYCNPNADSDKHVK